MPLNPNAPGAAPAAAPAPNAAPAAARGAGRGGARGARGGARGGAAGGAPGGGGGGGAPGAAVDWTPANLDPHPETVQVYSNAEEVELFLNDKSLGTKKRGDLLPPGPNGNKIDINAPRTFSVDFAPGTLKAVARNNGQDVAANVLTTAGAPAKISLTPSTTTLANDFDHLAYISVDITDDKGTLVPSATNHVTFTVSGPGQIAAVVTSPLVAQDFHAPEHDARNGRIALYLRSTANSGPITLTASSPNLPPSSLTLNAAPPAP
jgi:beta-galactosidase